MEIVRTLLSMTLTALAAGIIISLIWYLYESLSDRAETEEGADSRRAAQLLAVGIAGFTGGILCIQFYTMITNKYYPDAHEITPAFPLAVASLIGLFGGAALKGWILRPRKVKTWIWLSVVTFVAAILIGIRIIWL